MSGIQIMRFPPLGYACDEAINTLCTNLTFSGQNVRRIMITSCHASEGKSFLTMNIMRTMTEFGRSVVFVDADLRRSMIRTTYGLQYDDDEKHHMGLAHYLNGMTDLESVLYSTNIKNAWMIPIGREVNNPKPLLTSEKMPEMLKALGKRFDYVLVDAPPLGTVIDAAQIAGYCDGAVLSVRYNSVRRQELLDVKEQLEATGCPILGCVLNQVEYDSYLSKKYQYKYYYSKYSKGKYYYGGSEKKDKK